jgi:hypothetical protein
LKQYGVVTVRGWGLRRLLRLRLFEQGFDFGEGEAGGFGYFFGAVAEDKKILCYFNAFVPLSPPSQNGSGLLCLSFLLPP